VSKNWMTELKNAVLEFRWAGLPSTIPVSPRPKGSFATRDGKRFAGTHLIVDFLQAANLDDSERIEGALLEAVRATDATLLHIHLHTFEMGGLSGVAVLAESHITIHTWPQYGYAALDFFMCGKCNPYLAIPVLRCALVPREVRVQEFLRGEGLAFDCATVTHAQIISPRDGREVNGPKPRDTSLGSELRDA
jgi:S-adenosylmethionine decarboxylase